VVEILKDGQPAKPGEVGEVVITDLNNHCLPFIRYRIGDLAEAIDPAEACACGRGLPRIGKIEGRVQSIIIGSEGQYLPGSFFLHVFKDYDHAIRQFQIVQEARGAIVLKLVKGARYSDETLAELVGLLHKFLGAEMKIEVEFCENIVMVRTGKRLPTVSRLGIDFQARDRAVK
jgi:phenylacetate-CoA ligase